MEGGISRLSLGLPGEYAQAPGGVREVLGGELKAEVGHETDSTAVAVISSKPAATWLDMARSGTP